MNNERTLSTANRPAKALLSASSNSAEDLLDLLNNNAGKFRYGMQTERFFTLPSQAYRLKFLRWNHNVSKYNWNQ